MQRYQYGSSFCTQYAKGEDDKLHTTLFRKPTDCNSVLYTMGSYHQKNKIPYGQFQRVKIICDQDFQLQRHSVQM